MNTSMKLGAAMTLSAMLASATLAQPIGETPAVANHVSQSQIESGAIGFKALMKHGRQIFNARFNMLDGRGRPHSTGAGVFRANPGPAFLRTSGPDASSCQGCHNQPRSGGGGDFVANVFVLAQTLDPVTFSVAPEFSNERNTPGMFGAGPIEMLAREMSTELIAIREAAKAQAKNTGKPVTKALKAKGVSFGSLTAMPNGKIDPSKIEGVDWDLIVKPFHQKGAVVSLREFNNNALNHHHGIQSTERFGFGTDPDGDKVFNELTDGDVTALTIFQAGLATPGLVWPDEEPRKKAVAIGVAVFKQVGCTACHVEQFTLSSRLFSEPSPFNPAGNLQPKSVKKLFTFDMTEQGQAPRLEKAAGGKAIVRPFTDLKRHNLNDKDFKHFANELLPQGMINGFAPASDFTIAPFPRPTQQFLTRKLWECGDSAPYGHRGDLSTITEAIHFHGGEARASRDAFFARPLPERQAVVEFLKSLRLPDGE